MIATTAGRVPKQTAEHVNERIRSDTEMRLAHYRAHPEQIPRRLRELDREWDIERTLATNSAIVTLGGLALGMFINKRWLILPMIVQGFFLQHALQGWCPPLPLFRRLGVRTQVEIEGERYALLEMQADESPSVMKTPHRRDEVEEASIGSFPASDPPASTGASATPSGKSSSPGGAWG